MGKPARKSKTIVANIVSLLGVWAAYKGIDIPPDMMADLTVGILTIVNVGNIILRYLTKEPIK